MMQQQTEINTSTRHVKVAYKGEFRRFALPSLKFTQLEDTLRTLYDLGSSSFKVKFQDDENDWVVMNTDEELKYAVELTSNPIRLAIDDVQPLQAVEQKQAFESVITSPEVTAQSFEEPTPEFSPRGGFGKGRGRGGCGRGKGKHSGPIVLERLQMKQERVGRKIASMEEELKTPELSSERERVLLWRLEKLKNKLAFVEKRRQAIESGINENSNVPDGEHDFAADRGWKRRGCGRGRFARRADPYDHHGPHHGPHGPGRKGKKFGRDLPPMEDGAAREAIKNFAKAKADLENARNSGDMHAIVTCERTLKQAKCQKKQGKCVLLAPYRSHKRDCAMNLKRAKQSGDEAQMKVCEEALVEAIVAIRKAKAELTA